MAFLTLNGWTPGPRSGTVRRAEEVVGRDVVAFSGRRLRPRRATRGLWDATTKVATQAEQEALRGLLLGIGDHWPLDVSPYPSGKGLVSISTVVAPLEIAVALGGGDPVFEAKKFIAAVRPTPATTNIATTRDLDGASFVLTAATEADDSTDFINGAGSKKITFTASGGLSLCHVIEVGSGASDPTTDYAGSCYIRGDGSTVDVDVYLKENAGATGTKVRVTLQDGVWQHVENLVITTGAGGNTLELHVDEAVIDELAVFQIDGVQVEQRASSTAFEDSASARAAPSLSYPAAFVALGNQGMTVNAWTRGPNLEDPSGDTFLALVGDLGAGNVLALGGVSGTDHIKLITLANGVEPANLEHTGLWDGAWHLITGVLRLSAQAGTAERELYVDGVLVASDSPGTIPTPASMAVGTVFIGNAGGGDSWNGPIEDLSVLPYPAAAAQVLAWASETEQLPDTPTVRAGGDFDARPSVDVVPVFDGGDYVEGAIAGTFHSNSGTTKFKLREDG